MMPGAKIAPKDFQELGGIVLATIQIWMDCILEGNMKVLEMVLIGITGKVTIIH